MAPARRRAAGLGAPARAGARTARPAAGPAAEPTTDGPDADADWVPDRGDVVWLEFDPQAGREQAGRRPAVVLSPASYNGPTSRALCVPVTTKAKGYPFEVPLPPGFPVQGVAFADQVKCLDWRARHARPVAALPPVMLAQLLARTRALLE
jgi:mRNA interferase MazF